MKSADGQVRVEQRQVDAQIEQRAENVDDGLSMCIASASRVLNKGGFNILQYSLREGLVVSVQKQAVDITVALVPRRVRQDISSKPAALRMNPEVINGVFRASFKRQSFLV